MQTPLEIIQKYGAPTNSYVAAIKYFRNEHRPMTKEQCENGIAEIVGSKEIPSFGNEKEASLYFLYTVQETIRAFHGDSVPQMDYVWEQARTRASTFIREHEWAVKDYNTSATEDENGQPKQKKGAKKDMAEELYKEMNDGQNDRPTIINAFVEQIGMSKAGATTYFHNLKKKYGYHGPKTVKKKKVAQAHKPAKSTNATKKKSKGPTKGEIARRVFKEMKGAPKEDVIARIVEEAGTTSAGANTYYCAAKKENQ